MNLDQLRYITTLAAEGNLSKTAESLGISQPALSKYLKKLESETGMKLFKNRKQRFIPTQAGQLYIQAAWRILDLMDHTRKAISALDGRKTDKLRIGVSANSGIAAMADIYPDLDRRFPGADIVIREGYPSELRKLLRKRELDGLIVTVYPEEKEWKILPVFEEELLLAVPAYAAGALYAQAPSLENPSAQADGAGNVSAPLTLDRIPFAGLSDFRDLIFVMPPESSRLYEMITDIFRKEAFYPKVAATTPNVLLPEAMIRSGLRAGLLPSHHFRKDDDISFFRIRNTKRLVIGYLSTEDHEYTQIERYLLYLFLRNEQKKPGQRILYSGELQGIVNEFEPGTGNPKQERNWP